MKDKVEFGKIMIEVDGELVNIKDLPKPQYEHFLDITNRIRAAYLALSR